MKTLTVARALTFIIANRVINIATIITAVGFILLTGLSWALAYFFSSWWWLLMVPVVAWLIVFLGIRAILRFIVKRIYSEQFSKKQSKALNEFVDKIWELLEAKSTPMPFIVAICIKDILFHRDIITIKKFIGDSASLKSDYTHLEKLF